MIKTTFLLVIDFPLPIDKKFGKKSKAPETITRVIKKI